MSRRALVTGGTGFVGSHLVERLVGNGYSVTCLVRDLRYLRWLEGMEVILLQGDCTEPASLAVAVQGVSHVFHCAGLIKAIHAGDYCIVNHLGTKNLLQPGGGRPQPGRASGRRRRHTASRIRLRQEQLLAEDEALGYKDRFPAVILRPTSVYGPRNVDVFVLFRWADRGLTLEP